MRAVESAYVFKVLYMLLLKTDELSINNFQLMPLFYVSLKGPEL